MTGEDDILREYDRSTARFKAERDRRKEGLKYKIFIFSLSIFVLTKILKNDRGKINSPYIR